MNHKYIFIVLMLSTQTIALPAIGAETNSAKASCYSAYHFQQRMDLSVNFGSSVQQQKTKLDIDVHVKEIAVSEHNRSLLKGDAAVAENIRSFVIFINPNSSKVNGVEVDMSERYLHPFLVFVDGDSGKMIGLKSTVKESEILNEYMSFFDLFQYSERSGEYLYRNGNGRYQAQITQAEKGSGQLTRKNTGYLESDDKNKGVHHLQESILSITLDEAKAECFYRKGEGGETFKRVLSAKAFVEGDAKITIEADLTRALPAKHFFYRLTDELAAWPVFEKVETVGITREEALEKLPFMLTELSSLTEDRSQFIAAMLADKELWPHLAEYVLANELSDELSVKLFWSLDKIDSAESVNALAQLATSPLSDRDLFRAVMALGSTSASFGQNSVEMLKNHMANFTNPEFSQTESLTFIRMLGAMVDNRSASDPLQSNELRSFLYTQAGSFDESVNAAVIDAIGNLKGSIDIEGEKILLQGLSEESDKVRLSAVSAFKRVPYKSENSDVFIDQLNSENNIQIKSTLIDVMGKTDNSDLEVKYQLLSLIDDSISPKLKNKSLGSLKKIDYVFEDEDILILEAKLRKETDKASQRLLAALILKHRRNQ